MEEAMRTPYNIDTQNSCSDCTFRAERQFCNMAAPAVKALDAIKFMAVYPKGSVLFVEGEQPRGVFIVCSGRVKLTTSSSEGKTLIVKIAEAGEVLGASGTILDMPFEVSAETLEPSQINFVRREDFMRFLNTNREACPHTAQQLSERYHSAQRDIRSGTIELLMRARSGDWKRIRSASEGEILGVESLVSLRPNDATARTITPCDVGFIERESFLRVLNESPAIWFSVLWLLSQGVNASYDSLRNVAQARA